MQYVIGVNFAPSGIMWFIQSAHYTFYEMLL